MARAYATTLATAALIRLHRTRCQHALGLSPLGRLACEAFALRLARIRRPKFCLGCSLLLRLQLHALLAVFDGLHSRGAHGPLLKEQGLVLGLLLARHRLGAKGLELLCLALRLLARGLVVRGRGARLALAPLAPRRQPLRLAGGRRRQAEGPFPLTL